VKTGHSDRSAGEDLGWRGVGEYSSNVERPE
jgi:hypothetical protein